MLPGQVTRLMIVSGMVLIISMLMSCTYSYSTSNWSGGKCWSCWTCWSKQMSHMLIMCMKTLDNVLTVLVPAQCCNLRPRLNKTSNQTDPSYWLTAVSLNWLEMLVVANNRTIILLLKHNWQLNKCIKIKSNLNWHPFYFAVKLAETKVVLTVLVNLILTCVNIFISCQESNSNW